MNGSPSANGKKLLIFPQSVLKLKLNGIL